VPEAPQLLSVGRVTKAQGLKGEVLVYLSTNRTERMVEGAQFHTNRGVLQIASVAVHGDRWRVRFEGSTNRTAAEALQGLELRAEPIDDPDALWVHELIGRAVRLPTGDHVGIVTEVEANPASDLLVLDTGALVPLRFVVSSAADGILIDPPVGLLDESEQV
jgi:16S rRNA processing protein RimM